MVTKASAENADHLLAQQNTLYSCSAKWFSLCGGGGGGGTSVNFCWVCAAGLSEPLPHYSLLCGQLKTLS